MPLINNYKLLVFVLVKIWMIFFGKTILSWPSVDRSRYHNISIHVLFHRMLFWRIHHYFNNNNRDKTTIIEWDRYIDLSANYYEWMADVKPRRKWRRGLLNTHALNQLTNSHRSCFRKNKYQLYVTTVQKQEYFRPF